MATIVGTLGDDFQIIDFNNGDDEIFGDSSGTVTVAVGSDRVLGRGGDDDIAGDARVIGPAGRGGGDVVQGGDGDDDIYGDALRSLYGVGGDDAIHQNGGNGFLVGDAETIEAGGQGGDDRLHGGGGGDVLWGDGLLSDFAVGGEDRFSFSGGFGDDAVLDFRQGEDVLVFQGLEAGDLSITLDAGSTVLTTLGDDSVTLVGFADPFAFGADVIFA